MQSVYLSAQMKVKLNDPLFLPQRTRHTYVWSPGLFSDIFFIESYHKTKTWSETAHVSIYHAMFSIQATNTTAGHLDSLSILDVACLYNFSKD